MDYAELEVVIRAAPKTYIPALMIELVKAAYGQDVFEPGGASKFIERIEEKGGFQSDQPNRD